MSPTDRGGGYRGIWFRLGQFDGPHGDKYAGGLGTYTAKHVPMAAYAPAVDRTFFTYGGTPRGERDLRIMAAWYDHGEHAVPRPAIVDRKPEPNPAYEADTVVDPHDNASLAIGGGGHVWVFVAGRGRARPGRIYRSVDPYAVDAFERVAERELFAYPQPWWLGDRFFVCFTIYDREGSRELFWSTSPDGRSWSTPSKLAGIGGHYQVSEARAGTVVTAFNWHPDGDVDRRTNLYVLRTRDAGATWETVDGDAVDLPIESPENDALVVDYAARDRLVYLSDVAVDAAGNPAVLYVTSGGPEPGPANDPREWRLTRWDGAAWRTRTITTSDHNYDTGSLHLRDDARYVVGPTEPGPQPYHTGGAMAVWRSPDWEGWERVRTFPTRPGHNATYARRPRDAAAPFEAFWADGDAAAPSDSRLYFAALDGRCFRLPERVEGDTAEPVAVDN